MKRYVRVTAAAAMFAVATASQAAVFITEWMYNGGPTGNSEFIEFTNRGPSAVDFAGWSFDDDSRAAGTVNLSAFGIVAAGESVILTELGAATFRAVWGLASTAKVIGGNTTNLGRNDEINLYDASNTLVDRLTYGDQSFPGTIRTLNASGNPTTLAAMTADTVSTAWVLSSVGDGFGSIASTQGDIGNPGQFPVPEPSAYMLLLAGLAAIFGVARRRPL